jgi:hypothetical protein
MTSDKFSIIINRKLEPNGWENMSAQQFICDLALSGQEFALVRNKNEAIALVTIHPTTMAPVFMDSCASLYLVNHLEPEIRAGVFGVNVGDRSYLLTISKRNKVLRFPRDGWSFKDTLDTTDQELML